MTTTNQARELKELLEETVAGLGATDSSYIQLLQYLAKNNKLLMPSRFLPGQIVFFKYKPQDNRFLSSASSYDVFPLVIITEVYKDGFEGLNLHFISKRWRRELFNAIEQSLPLFKNADTTRTRLGTTYKRIKGPRKFKFFKPCYRRYVRRGFRKLPIVIPSEFWDVLVDVDLALFIKGTKMGVRRMSYNSAIKTENNL